jgi:hypothetical protein
MEVCDMIKGFGLFSETVWTGELDIILGFTSVFQLLVAYSVFMMPKLAVHPASLIGFIALA